MKIILLKDITKVGKKYDIKDVADGFALNMLIPRGQAQIATVNAIKNIEILKANDLVEKKVQGELLVKSLETIKATVVNIKEKASEKGHLFAGITKERLAEEIMKATRLNIDPELIQLEKPLKEIGEHIISINAEGRSASFKVSITNK